MEADTVSAGTAGCDVDTVDSDRTGFASKKAGFWPAMDRQLLTFAR
jgi:hypothetical protein